VRVGKNGIRRKAPESIGGRKAGKNIPGRNAAFGRRPSQVNRPQSTVLRIGIPAKIVKGRKA